MFHKTSRAKASPARIAPPAAAGRSKGSKPEILRMLPANFLTSPGIIAGIFAFELIYGLVLAGVMSSMPKPEPEIVYVPEEPVQILAINTPSQADPLEASKEADAAKSRAAEEAKVRAAEVKAKALAAEEARKEEARKKALADKKRKEDQQKRAESRNKEISFKTALLQAQNVPPRANVQLKEQPNFGPFGPLINPSNDCEATEEPGGGFTIKIPNKLHTLSVTLNVANSPRAFMKATADFVAEVTIPEPFKPGTRPLIKAQPWVFQGAGLLLWRDQKNYIRLERAGMYLIGPDGGSRPQVRVENCRDGRAVNPVNKLVKSDGPIRLKMERRGNDILCSYSPDNGKTWIKLKQIPLELPETVEVGISASNVSTRELRAKFERFELNSPPAADTGRAG